ncbi:hypothetical protein Bhyg_07872 [Pseudolycoriella hygida]|uniref:DUF4780 domain-containing protein n=1 Tax=Pseudolycoriella hygida TaxID=35572 RepID=A0A9Q0N3U6_9DIPT|nr:hypothetical protein Bhyg_07872 [Pseudolycoriella hygida]
MPNDGLSGSHNALNNAYGTMPIVFNNVDAFDLSSSHPYVLMILQFIILRCRLDLTDLTQEFRSPRSVHLSTFLMFRSVGSKVPQTNNNHTNQTHTNSSNHAQRPRQALTTTSIIPERALEVKGQGQALFPTAIVKINVPAKMLGLKRTHIPTFVKDLIEERKKKECNSTSCTTVQAMPVKIEPTKTEDERTTAEEWIRNLPNWYSLLGKTRGVVKWSIKIKMNSDDTASNDSVSINGELLDMVLNNYVDADFRVEKSNGKWKTLKLSSAIVVPKVQPKAQQTPRSTSKFSIVNATNQRREERNNANNVGCNATHASHGIKKVNRKGSVKAKAESQNSSSSLISKLSRVSVTSTPSPMGVGDKERDNKANYKRIRSPASTNATVGIPNELAKVPLDPVAANTVTETAKTPTLTQPQLQVTGYQIDQTATMSVESSSALESSSSLSYRDAALEPLNVKVCVATRPPKDKELHFIRLHLSNKIEEAILNNRFAPVFRKETTLQKDVVYLNCADSHCLNWITKVINKSIPNVEGKLMVINQRQPVGYDFTSDITKTLTGSGSFNRSKQADQGTSRSYANPAKPVFTGPPISTGLPVSAGSPIFSGPRVFTGTPVLTQPLVFTGPPVPTGPPALARRPFMKMKWKLVRLIGKSSTPITITTVDARNSETGKLKNRESDDPVSMDSESKSNHTTFEKASKNKRKKNKKQVQMVVESERDEKLPLENLNINTEKPDEGSNPVRGYRYNNLKFYLFEAACNKEKQTQKSIMT